MRRLKLASCLTLTAFALLSCRDAREPLSPSEPEIPPAFSVGKPSTGRNASARLMSDQHVFLLDGKGSGADIADQVSAAGGTIVYAMDEIGVVLVRGLSEQSAATIAQGKGNVATDVITLWVPEPELHVQDLPAGAARELKMASIFEPETAPFYLAGLQWNMEITDTDDAWLRQYNGIPSVRVAILDTGLDPNHVELFGLIDAGSSRAFIPSRTGPPAWQDDHWHGTHVGALVTSNNFGMAGVAPDVTLIAVKVLDATGEGPAGAIIAGIYYAANLGVDVINMSFGEYLERGKNTALLMAAFNRAVNYAHARGVFVVAAAGNEAIDLQHDGKHIFIPCETGVLSCISATGALDLPAFYTNYGTNAINNAAPGGDVTQREPFPTGAILSACSSRSADPVIGPACRPNPDFPPPFNVLGTEYLWAQGTSAAVPHIAGLGAYLDSQHGGSLNGSQIRTAIEHHADDLGKRGTDRFFGKGRMNTCRTLPGCAPIP